MPLLKDVAHRADVKTRLLLFALAALALLSREANALGREAGPPPVASGNIHAWKIHVRNISGRRVLQRCSRRSICCVSR
jgi:hypothetical protein